MANISTQITKQKTNCSSLLDVIAIILNWNNAVDTIACLKSLEHQDYPHRVIVIDNGSTDESVAIIREQFPSVQLIETGKNLGYAGGNNIGIQHALDNYQPNYIFVVNNDVILERNCLSILVNTARKNILAGFLGPKIYQSDIPDQIQSAGTVVTKWGEAYQRGLDELDNGQYDTQCEVGSLVGCAILIRAETLRTIGLLDERFYLYREDIDWCIRARKAGYKILYVPRAKVWHCSSNVRDENLPYIQYYMARNSYLLLYKNEFGLPAIFRMLIKHLVWLVNWTINPKWSHKRKLRNALLKALVDATLGRYGKQAHYFGVNNA